MTLFAILMAGTFPILHMGRAWFIYWLWPYPATMDVWPQFRSSLTFDAVAIPTYLLVSLLFWYLGMVPDLASARATAPTLRRRRIYGVLALGWRGSTRHWYHLRVAQGLMAALATPLVVSVHTIISYDFSIAPLVGWHSTLLPPEFVIGALHSGFAMVVLLVVPLRGAWRLGDVITGRHLDALGSMLLMLGSLLGYCYVLELVDVVFRGDSIEEQYFLHLRPFGPYGAIWWTMVGLNVVLPQLLWWQAARRSPVVLTTVAVAVLAGMWLERLDIVVAPLMTDYLPSSWRTYTPTLVDAALFWGSLSTFFFLFLVCIRLLPPIPIHEVKALRHTEEAS
jgi:molybdopterin-containing oxidoreductase family membrane subunit